MRIEQGNRFTALRGVDGFVDVNEAKLPATAASGARANFKARLATLATTAGVQDGSTKLATGFTSKQNALREVLIDDHMQPIARIAKADLPHTPELTPLKMPRGNRSNEQLIKAAEGMAQVADGHADVFVEAGLPKDFTDRLRKAAAELSATIDRRTAARGSRGSATQSLEKQLVAARRQVEVLDSFVRLDLKAEPALLAEWNIVKKPPTKAVRPNMPATSPAPATAPAPASVAAPAPAAAPSTQEAK